MANSLSKIVTCVLALVLSFSTVVSAEGTIDTEYNKSASISRWRSDGDFVTPVLMIKAAAMSRSGYTKDQIIDNLTEHRADYARHQAAGLRRDWEVNKDYKMLIRHGGALVGVGVEAATKEIFDASVVGQAISDIGVFSYESLIRDGKVRSASRALGLNYETVDRAEDSIASYVSDTFDDNELFREVYAEQFAATMGFAPNDDVETVNQAFPEFGSNENVKEVLNILRDESGAVKVSLSEAEKADLTGVWAESLNGLRKDNASRLDEISQTDSASLNLLRKIELQENKRKALELSRAKDRVRMEGLRSGAYLAGTAIGLIDEDLGRQFNAVTTAAFEINRSIEAFSAATKLGEDLTGSASMIMTGDFVGVALSLVGAFGSSGPSADELILEQLAKIREEIAQVRKEMHERFDIVDKKLDAIYERMDDGFISLESELRRTTNRSLLSIQRALQDIQASHYTALSIDIDQTDLQIAYLKAFELNPCLGRK